MELRGHSWWSNSGPNGVKEAENKLPRALVGGLLLEVLLEARSWPANPWVRREEVKARLRSSLVTHLAGHAPLQTFRTVAENLETWFDLFYPLVAGMEGGCGGTLTLQEEAAPYVCQGPAGRAGTLREDLLTEHLEGHPGLWPRRRHRKFDREKLLEFLRGTGGGWFRLGEFERFFGMERKTAWEYVQKLIRSRVLVHNEGRSAAVRYRLAPRFLKGEN